MAVPEGYSPLGRLGYVDRGTYAASTKYMKGDVVYYNGSTYTALKDNLTGVTPVNGSNWKYMARGFSADNLSNVQAKDTSGVIGTAGATVVSQDLIDAIADKVMTKLLAKTDIVQTESTATNKVPSSAYVKQMFDTANCNLADAIIKSTYKTALRSPDKTHTLGIHDNGTAYMDDTKVITNADFQAGTITITSQANTTITQKVTFPTAFSAMPKVTLTPMTSDPEKVVITPSAVTTTGFQANLRATVSNAYTISWIAAN